MRAVLAAHARARAGMSRASTWVPPSLCSKTSSSCSVSPSRAVVAGDWTNGVYWSFQRRLQSRPSNTVTWTEWATLSATTRLPCAWKSSTTGTPPLRHRQARRVLFGVSMTTGAEERAAIRVDASALQSWCQSDHGQNLQSGGVDVAGSDPVRHVDRPGRFGGRSLSRLLDASPLHG